ncbi:MAG TPA: pyridoxal 5'-phosphate synthase lyase subunit PdxS [Thermotogota bacterium]|jgi:pyridoxal 5'-phosphate synthase pdxS subunit|nr:pyridoxal 5'-phosphate synthase lyase subunit PdxS [Thermotogota bacterium]NLH19300.1 pyridoxal 5'-phosphate synthase lyase subunit PdxS [Thermotogaceae bacterium]OQC32437.1 MAG: Pyridoxal biosynthesis lyase PdxS [Thermotogota bacterium ADurb.Bin062]HNW45776.1 pyridoxal 5'-phosphate synthase lyase subunit PdxS [Thermotogota bacterium]HNY81311.1 pyridoxal 5'-phosphate synthase lyase subunit PdxS [Thermotogota bacterium]
MESKSTWTVKTGFADMFKNGVIMDVTDARQAKIAQDAGAVAVMALDMVPADIRKTGGVARMASIKVIKEIMNTVSIPVMAKCRIGHIAEARVLEAIGVDFIDESEVLTPADDRFHVNKHEFKVPFVCGCRNLGEALRRIAEGAAMMRTKGEAGTGNIVEAVKHARQVWEEVRKLQNTPDEELVTVSKETGAPIDLIRTVKKLGKLPVVNFAAGGVATPADAALMMILGMDGVFVGSGIFKSEDPTKMASAIVQAVRHWNDFNMLAKISEDLPPAMKGIDISELEVHLQERGW